MCEGRVSEALLPFAVFVLSLDAARFFTIDIFLRLKFFQEENKGSEFQFIEWVLLSRT